MEDAKPGDVETVVQEQLNAANTKVVIEELVSYASRLARFVNFHSRIAASSSDFTLKGNSFKIA